MNAIFSAVLSTFLAACLAGVSGLAAAQAFPSRPVTLIVPFPPGGPSDVLGRVIAQGLSKPLEQQVVVENVGGAGGTVGAGRAAQAKPDGYTILLSHIGQATSVTLYRKLPYDPVEAFDTIGLIGEVPMVISARKDLPPANVQDLLAFLRANRGAANYGNGGTGSASHLCGLLFMSSLQAEMNVVSYRGSGPAMTDLVAGRIDLVCDQTTTVAPQLRNGAIKAYAVTLKQRLPSMPDVPTLHEAGLRDFEHSTWYGLHAPRGIPKPALDRLAAALRAALTDPAIAARLVEFGVHIADAERASPAWFNAYMRREVAKWAPIIKAAGVYAD